jgi:hypothetical protein
VSAGAWSDLESAGLLGTARRTLPWPYDDLVVARVPADPQVLFLDAVALGAAARRAGRLPLRADGGFAATDDATDVAPQRAADLLSLYLTQPIVSAELAPALLEHWLATCRARGFRLPPRLLPAMLDRGTKSVRLRHGLVATAGERGRWLAGINDDWSWLGEASIAEAEDDYQVRRRIAETWNTAGARDRRSMLEALQALGVRDEDEPVLESALDDRAATVRELAAAMLDAVPASLRAARMAQRLRPLISVRRGLGRPRLDIELPDDPDAAGVRDGLVTHTSGSRRGFWLTRIAAGAPLEVWTESGMSVAEVARGLSDDALAGVLRAVLLRDAADWAAALLERGADPMLIRALPAAARGPYVADRLKNVADADLPPLLQLLPGPWDSAISLAAVKRLRAAKDPQFAASAFGVLPERIHADAARPLADWAASLPDPSPLLRPLRSLIQFQSALRSIDEAFA